MAKFIKIKLEETYQIPDEWELVTNEEGITKIKVSENEFYDFGTIPYCSPSLQSDEEMMLLPEEYLELQTKGLDLIMADGKVSVVEDENEIKEIIDLANEED
ncbi:hypothetical protein GCM10012288_13710 [Malaciobacter pacificus]|jgi:hypothetical protein|uniref:Uncharacterized protein n=1 Tax=Malaciobacter pacificus TaxID=1080223 RepID=A0A5C2H7C0_9BACT|nr:hypothetical protein [Malaciobacter pacificus]QEP34851.1 hypothetical protein APAC_1763 [Malaciobacter pacificus]GGD40908.1 hypothetical protein GCM10012288_13710 [Malaciobacter pacificus]